ncbi:trypsin-like [Pleurodeles waltl]|uniref:trypsin-like n=1 Tax=Pleurodeles waltl TaxID=8319 RepID=UPI003709A552
MYNLGDTSSLKMKLFLLLVLAAWHQAAAYPTKVEKVENVNDIINGYSCAYGSIPWQVFLTYKTDKGDHFCGGSLINQWWILSAAHCQGIPGTMVVRLGEHILSANEGTEQFIYAAKQIRHPNYNPQVFDNDIMLIKLAQAAQYNQYVYPIPLPSSCVATGTWCTVSGWGNMVTNGVMNANALQCLNQPIISSEQCQQAYPSEYTNNMMCSGYMQGGWSTCQGDSGGPLVCNGELQGIVSWAYKCAVAGHPTVFTKVCNYHSWIYQVMSEN